MVRTMPGRREDVVVLDEEQVDHEADDLAGGEVLAGGLVRELAEAADELLVEVAHLDVADDVGMEVDLGDLRQHEVQQLGAVEPADLSVEVELLDDVARLGIEGRDPGAQVAGDLGRVGEELLEGQGRGVVDLDAGDGLEHRTDVVELAIEGGEAATHLVLRGLEHAVEAPQDDERQDGLAVLVRLVVAAQQVGDGPDESGVVVRTCGCRGR